MSHHCKTCDSTISLCCYESAQSEVGSIGKHEDALDIDFWREVIREWKHGWFREPDYRVRVMGVDSNMTHDLAQKIVDKLKERI